jgi:diadenosine tetraphosphate (Ap4A) HIT family hydrolase
MAVNSCPFCKIENSVMNNELAWARYDLYPVSPGHMLIITKRHVADFFETTPEERRAINDLLEEAKHLLERDFKPDGYNIGVNCGESAGQTIMHLHVHLIPRYQGDMDNPRGGVRGVIPDKRVY